MRQTDRRTSKIRNAAYKDGRIINILASLMMGWSKTYQTLSIISSCSYRK